MGTTCFLRTTLSSTRTLSVMIREPTCGQQGTAFINRGNVLRNNTFRKIRMQSHTNLGYPSVQAIYLDDQMAGWQVRLAPLS